MPIYCYKIKKTLSILVQAFVFLMLFMRGSLADDDSIEDFPAIITKIELTKGNLVWFVLNFDEAVDVYMTIQRRKAVRFPDKFAFFDDPKNRIFSREILTSSSDSYPAIFLWNQQINKWEGSSLNSGIYYIDLANLNEREEFYDTLINNLRAAYNSPDLLSNICVNSGKCAEVYKNIIWQYQCEIRDMISS